VTQHILLFLLVGWLVALAFFAREATSPAGTVLLASRKLLRYTVYTILLAGALYGLERLFIYPF